MPPKHKSTKQPPPNTTEQPLSDATEQPLLDVTKRTRSTGRTRAATNVAVVQGSQKRKAKDLPPEDQPTKRPNAKSSKSNRARPPADIAEPMPNTEPIEQSAATTRRSQVTGRKVPARPPLSSESEDEDGDRDLQNQTTDGDATTPLPSEDETDEVLTATQLTEEYPVAVRASTNNRVIEGHEGNGRDNHDNEMAAVRPNGGKRVERLIREIPIPGPSFQQPDYSLDNVTDHGTTAIVQDVNLPTNLFPNPRDLMPPIPGWPAFTELNQAEDGSYKQTGQIIEINNCLSVAVRRANSNLVLKGSFPDIEEQEKWLADALKFALSTENQGHVISKVEERAKVDINYFNCLLSMIRNRWSGYRQSALNMARDLVCPRPKRGPAGKTNAEKAKAKKDTRVSLYKLSGSDDENAAAAAKLLDYDAFHFARTNTDAPDSSAPYQHQAVLAVLAYFFKCDKSLKSRVPIGEHGPEVPKPMVALATTLLEVALEEVAEQEQVRFSEDMQRERYIGHLNSFEEVRVSKKGDAKLARLLSDVYNGTMKVLSSKGTGSAVPSVPARRTMMNADLLRV